MPKCACGMDKGAKGNMVDASKILSTCGMNTWRGRRGGRGSG